MYSVVTQLQAIMLASQPANDSRLCSWFAIGATPLTDPFPTVVWLVGGSEALSQGGRVVGVTLLCGRLLVCLIVGWLFGVLCCGVESIQVKVGLLAGW